MLVCWVCTYEGVIVFDFQQYFFFKSQKIRNKKEKKERKRRKRNNEKEDYPSRRRAEKGEGVCWKNHVF